MAGKPESQRRWTLAGRWVTTLEDVCAVRREALNDPEKAYLIPQCDSLISMIKADMGLVITPYAVVPPVAVVPPLMDGVE